MSGSHQRRFYCLSLSRRLVQLFLVLALASPLTAAPRLGLTMYGTVTSVDPALQNTFRAGDPFQFGFTIDPVNINDGSFGVLIHATDLYFRAGSSYHATSSTHTGEVVAYHDSIGNGPSGQGITFEKNNMLAPAANGFPLTDTYIDIGLINAFNTREIREPQLLNLNGQPIVNQDNSLSFDFSPQYKYVRFDINSIEVLVPEPSAALLVVGASMALSMRRRLTVNRIR